MGSLRRRRGRTDGAERGATLVEFALLAPLLFALVFGMLTGGLALSTKNSMDNAVREGGRLGATLPEGDSWAASVQQRVVQLSGGDLTTNQVCVKLIRKADATTEVTRRQSACPAALAGAEPSAAAVPAGECAVKVWARATRDLNVIFFSRQLPLNVDSINRYERSGSPATCG
jgi:Flp pilus assembly protein TadG